MKNTLRSVGAIFAGILVNIVIAVPIDVALHLMGVFPPWNRSMSDSLCVLATSYRLVAALLGGYTTAHLAPQRPMEHALILGVIGVFMSAAGAIAMWDKGTHWYPLLLVAISVPCSWVGAKIRLMRTSKT